MEALVGSGAAASLSSSFGQTAARTANSLSEAASTVNEAVLAAEGTVNEAVLAAEGKVGEAMLAAEGTVSGAVLAAEGKVSEAVLAAEGKVSGAMLAAEGTVSEAVLAAEGKVSEAVLVAEGTVNEAVLAAEHVVAASSGKTPSAVAAAKTRPAGTAGGAIGSASFEEVVAAAGLPALATPGIGAMNTVIHAVTEPKSSGSFSPDAIEFLMAQPLGDIFKVMASSGWESRPVDEAAGLWEAILPAVHFSFPGGVVRMPSPVIRTHLSPVKVPGYRGVVDMTLQNGDGICEVDLPFPFCRTVSLSAACGARTTLGWSSGMVHSQTDCTVGFTLPQVPGLGSLMQMFAKAFLGASAQQCAQTLAEGAEPLHRPHRESRQAGADGR